MKKLVFLLICLVGSQVLTAQTNKIEDTVSVYMEPALTPALQLLKIPVGFDRASLQKSIPKSLSSRTIQRIDLVYTTYKANPAFDQLALNKQRIDNLLDAFPEARNHLIEWHIIGQSAAQTSSAAHKLFHGFVIYYRPEPTPERIEEEISYLDELLGLKKTVGAEAKGAAVDFTAGSKLSERTRSMETERSSFSAEPEFKALRQPKLENACYTLHTGSRTTSEKEFERLKDSIMDIPHVAHMAWSWTETGKGLNRYIYAYYLQKEACIDTLSVSWFQNDDADAVRETFLRHPKWQNTLIVMDVTGSMSPYIGKTMAWVKATQGSSQVAAFVYFNDGDSKTTAQKVSGNVGGVYSVRNTDFDKVYNQMKYTMRKGGGGDCPENNVEATIYGMAEYPKCDEVVMVADNWASPRDLEFVGKLQRPVHIIVCGSRGGVNMDYVQLAYETGGSVHTIEEDIEMRDIKPGKQFRIGTQFFTLVNGKIVRAENKY